LERRGGSKTIMADWLDTLKRKKIIMSLLFVLGLIGVPMTRQFMLMIMGYELIAPVDVGFIVGILSFIGFTWKWKRKE